jgi:hypothetical protein
MITVVRNRHTAGEEKVYVHMHLNPSPEIGRGEKRAALMREGAVRITVLIRVEAAKRLRPRFDTLVLVGTRNLVSDEEHSRTTRHHEMTNDWQASTE